MPTINPANVAKTIAGMLVHAGLFADINHTEREIDARFAGGSERVRVRVEWGGVVVVEKTGVARLRSRFVPRVIGDESSYNFDAIVKRVRQRLDALRLRNVERERRDAETVNHNAQRTAIVETLHALGLHIPYHVEVDADTVIVRFELFNAIGVRDTIERMGKIAKEGGN